MTSLRIFDPPQCCSTGVCGSDVDPALVQFAADLKWLATRGVAVERFNLAQQPEAFVREAVVREAVSAAGMGALPLVIIDGSIATHGRYPDREELAQIAGLRGEEAPLLSLDVVPSPCCGPDDECC